MTTLDQLISKLQSMSELGFGDYEIVNPSEYDLVEKRPQYSLEITPIVVSHNPPRKRIRLQFKDIS